MNLNKNELFAIIFFFVLVSWAIVPFFMSSSFTLSDIGYAIILIVIGLTYMLTAFVPQWNKSAIMSDGVVFILTSLFLFSGLNRYVFFIFGACLILLSVLAYDKRLPPKLLKHFYKERSKKWYLKILKIFC